jgi:hypothetical protein
VIVDHPPMAITHQDSTRLFASKTGEINGMNDVQRAVAESAFYRLGSASGACAACHPGAPLAKGRCRAFHGKFVYIGHSDDLRGAGRLYVRPGRGQGGFIAYETDGYV